MPRTLVPQRDAVGAGQRLALDHGIDRYDARHAAHPGRDPVEIGEPIGTAGDAHMAAEARILRAARSGSRFMTDNDDDDRGDAQRDADQRDDRDDRDEAFLALGAAYSAPPASTRSARRDGSSLASGRNFQLEGPRALKSFITISTFGLAPSGQFAHKTSVRVIRMRLSACEMPFACETVLKAATTTFGLLCCRMQPGDMRTTSCSVFNRSGSSSEADICHDRVPLSLATCLP